MFFKAITPKIVKTENAAVYFQDYVSYLINRKKCDKPIIQNKFQAGETKT